MESQTTQYLLMIRPVRFGYNAETAVNNAFQVASSDQLAVQKMAAKEFDLFVNKLQDAGVDVTVISDTHAPHTPDSIFPNNWVSFHADGTVILYPMFADNRRLERDPDILKKISKRFIVHEEIDLSESENNNQYLEGTGSMVLDRENKLSYACLSPRTHPALLEQWAEITGYQTIVFDAADENGTPIYHTNVLMAVADRYVVICLDAIPKPNEREMVIQAILNSGKEIVDISFAQMNRFAGNMLQVHNNTGEKILVMSLQAWRALTPEHQEKLKGFNRIVQSDIQTIETNGGGSARCMMAEIHLPVKVEDNPD